MGKSKGFIFTVKPIGGTARIKEYIEQSEGKTSEWCFGLHFDIIDDEIIKVHLPLEELNTYLKGDNSINSNSIISIAKCINELTSIDFSYYPKKFLTTYANGPVDIQGSSWACVCKLS